MGPPVAVEYRGQPAFYTHVHTWSEHVVAVAEHVVGIARDAPTDVSCIVGCAVLTGVGAREPISGQPAPPEQPLALTPVP